MENTLILTAPQTEKMAEKIEFDSSISINEVECDNKINNGSSEPLPVTTKLKGAIPIVLGSTSSKIDDNTHNNQENKEADTAGTTTDSTGILIKATTIENTNDPDENDTRQVPNDSNNIKLVKIEDDDNDDEEDRFQDASEHNLNEIIDYRPTIVPQRRVSTSQIPSSTNNNTTTALLRDRELRVSTTAGATATTRTIPSCLKGSARGIPRKSLMKRALSFGSSITDEKKYPSHHQQAPMPPLPPLHQQQPYSPLRLQQQQQLQHPYSSPIYHRPIVSTKSPMPNQQIFIPDDEINNGSNSNSPIDNEFLLHRIRELEVQLGTISNVLALQQQQQEQKYPRANNRPPRSPSYAKPQVMSDPNIGHDPHDINNHSLIYDDDEILSRGDDDDDDDFQIPLFPDGIDNQQYHANIPNHRHNLSLMLLYEGNQAEYERSRVHGYDDRLMLASMTVAERNWLGPQILIQQQQEQQKRQQQGNNQNSSHRYPSRGSNRTPTISDSEEETTNRDDDDAEYNDSLKHKKLGNAATATEKQQRRQRDVQKQQEQQQREQSEQQNQPPINSPQPGQQQQQVENSTVENRRQELTKLEKTFRTKLTDLFEKPVPLDDPNGKPQQNRDENYSSMTSSKIDPVDKNNNAESAIQNKTEGITTATPLKKLGSSSRLGSTDVDDTSKNNSTGSNSAGTMTLKEQSSHMSDVVVDTEKVVRSKWFDFLNSFQESTSDVDDQMEEFIQVPGKVENVMTYGFFICVDSFLYMCTILPIRFVWNCFLLLIRILQYVGILSNSSTAFSKKYLQFHRQHTYQIIQVLIIYTVYRMILCPISIGKLYHWIRGQSMIKLYVIIAMVEIFDRLFSSLGQDCLDSMYWNTVSRPKSKRFIISILVVLIYVSVHTLILFVHVSTLNVAMNSADQALLTLLISGNFAEIKSTVFKKYNKPALFKITAGDICERFKLALFLSLILLLNVCQGMNKVQLMDYFRICCIVWVAELLADWIKHSFITKFNYLPSSVYPEYALILAGDVTGFGHENINLDHSHAVVKRIGFAQIPLIVVMFRLGKEAFKYASNNIPIIRQYIDFLRDLQLQQRQYGGLMEELKSPALVPQYSILYGIITEGGIYVIVWLILLIIKLSLGTILQYVSQSKLNAAPELLANTGKDDSIKGSKHGTGSAKKLKKS